MEVSYKKLFHLLTDIDITLLELQKRDGYSTNISKRLRKNTYINLETIKKICLVFEWKIDDVVDFVNEI